MDIAVTLDHVSKTFRDVLGRSRVEAVRGLSLEVPRGEIFGLLGPNGSGKTTTISMILGLLRPTAGHLEVLGRPPGSSDIRNRIGYLPEDFAPPDLLRGEEVLRYYGGFHAIPAPELDRRIEDALALLDMTEARRRRFRDYSKGMRRRIGLAQALLHEPELLVLDEPTNGLDPIGVQTVKTILLDLRERGRTVVICSHVLPELEVICDRIAILHRGECICSGRTADLLSAARRFQVVLDDVDRAAAESAASVLRDQGFQVTEVEPVRQSLESLFMDRVAGPEGEAGSGE